MKVSDINMDVYAVPKRPMYLRTCDKLGRGEILLKKKENVKVKTEQKLVKENDPIKFSEPSIIILKLIATLEQKDIEKVNKQYELYELYKNLNPKYSENIITLKETKLKIDSSDISFSSKFNIFKFY